MQADFVPPSEEAAFILSASQLSALIEKAIQPLQDEVSHLKATVASQDEKIAALEATQGTLSENQLIQLQLIHKMREDVHQIPQAPATAKKTKAHIDDLHRLMVEDRTQQVSIAKGARLLEISKERMRQLKPLILQDGRFELGWSQVKGKKAVVIRIRQFLK
jgi:predicted RNase H-like nuclease (RuvC/YqgF family)